MSSILIIASLASSLVRFRGDLIRSLRERGHEVVAAAPDPDADTIQQLSLMGVTCVPTVLSRAGMNPISDFGYMCALQRLIRKRRPEVVLAYTPKPVIYSGIACRGMSGVRHYALISGLGYGFGMESWRQRALSRLLGTLFTFGLERSAGVIFQNEDDRNLFVSRKIVRSEQTTLVSGSGVDLERFGVQPLPEGPTFLLMARLIPEKGIREYVAAARQLRRRVPQAQFLLAGWLERRRGAISRAELDAWQREGVIEYLGALEDVRPAISRAAVYVLPSYYREGVPRSVLEAMAMGRAVITTDMPGCRETVIHGVNGFLVAPRDERVLAHSMELLARDFPCVVRMGSASRLMAEQRFAVKAVNAQMLSAMGMAA